MFSSDTFLMIAILAMAAMIYLPIIRLAKADMKEREIQGESSGNIMLLLLIPILGPLIYLAIRQLRK